MRSNKSRKTSARNVGKRRVRRSVVARKGGGTAGTPLQPSVLPPSEYEVPRTWTRVLSYGFDEMSVGEEREVADSRAAGSENVYARVKTAVRAWMRRNRGGRIAIRQDPQTGFVMVKMLERPTVAGRAPVESRLYRGE